jgi:antitoxin component of MazEF toxin-antitoxin module
MSDDAPTEAGAVGKILAETSGTEVFEAAPPALAVLLAGVTPENLHGEVDAGPAVGNEAWS